MAFEKVVSTMMLLVPFHVNGALNVNLFAFPVPTTGVKLAGAITCVKPDWNVVIEGAEVAPIET